MQLKKKYRRSKLLCLTPTAEEFDPLFRANFDFVDVMVKTARQLVTDFAPPDTEVA
jgi:hypothetical protein